MIAATKSQAPQIGNMASNFSAVRGFMGWVGLGLVGNGQGNGALCVTVGRKADNSGALALA